MSVIVICYRNTSKKSTLDYISSLIVTSFPIERYFLTPVLRNTINTLLVAWD